MAKDQKQTINYVTISLNQAKKLRGALNTSASDLQEIADRQKKGLPSCGWKYHEFKAEQLKELGKLIDKKLKKL